MRSRITCLLIVSMILSTGTLRADESPLKPWIPPTQQVVISGMATIGTVAQIPRSQAAAMPLVHFSTSQPAHALNHIKGEFGERMMSSVFTSRVLKATGGWSSATPASIGRGGIDGLYFKMDSKGNFRDLLVADAKFGSSRLGMTRDGKQMSAGWIKPRLERTAKMYRDLAAEIKGGNISSARGTAKNMASNRVSIPLNDKTNIEIWKTWRGQLRYFCSDKSVMPADIEKQLTRASRYLDGAAAGNVKYRPRLFSYKASGKEHVIFIKKLDANANVIPSKPIKGTFSQLPIEYQNMIKSEVRRTLLAMGKSKGDVKILTREICDDPAKFNQLRMQAKHNFRAGLDTGSLKMAGIFGVLAVGIDGAAQYWENGQINTQRLLTTGAVTGGSVFVGNYAGTQTSLLLARQSTISPKFGGRLFGGAATSVLLAGGLWVTGQADAKTATTLAASGIATSTAMTTAYALPQLALWYAATYGTASTGAAISTLSGAAMTNASLAWLGGGTLAAGGGGVAGGSAVVTALSWTGPAVVVAVVAYSSYSVYKYFKNEGDQYRYVLGIVDLTRRRVQDGKQLEWKVAR